MNIRRFYTCNSSTQRRAETVVQYLIVAGISKTVYWLRGYGESIPIFADPKSEGDHQKNQRTSFTTLAEDFKEE